MYRLLLCAFLCLPGLTAWGQAVFRIDSLPTNGVILETNWKWHLGDHPAWARANLNDARWDTLTPTRDIALLPHLPSQGIGWLRLRLRIASSLRGKTVGLLIGQVGATELFLNGQLVAQAGRIGAQKQVAKGLVSQQIPSITLGADSLQLLAIRYAFSTQRLFSQPRYPFLIIQVVSAERAQQSRSTDVANLVVGSTLFGIFLALGFLQLLLFIASPRQRAALNLGLFLVTQGITYFIATRVLMDLLDVTRVALVNDYLELVFAGAITGSAYCYLRGMYQYFNQPKGVAFYLTAVLALATIPIALFSAYASLAYFVLSLLVPWLDILRVGYLALKQQKAGAQLFTITHGLLVGVFIVYTVAAFIPSFRSLLGDFFNYLFIITFLGLALTVTLLVSTERARANRLLLKQLIDLENLSQKAIRQEQEKQQLLATQNERLEEQVEARTAQLSQSLTELKSTQAQLIQKEKLASLGELTAGIAHEIQNPLNFVNNFSEVSAELVDDLELELNKGDMDEVKAITGDLRQNLHKIHHHGGKASAIVKAMLEHARTATGDLQSTNLNALVDEYLRLAYQGWRAKDKDFTCEVTTHFDSSVGPVTLIPQELGRVLLNLLNNAFYAVLERGKQRDVADYRPTVQVSTQREEGQVMIQVEDNGTGISDSVKAKIFQPFFTTKPTGEGTGLGLSLSYDIVTKGHGGILTLESQEGHGTTFTILLPAELSTNTDESHTH